MCLEYSRSHIPCNELYGYKKLTNVIKHFKEKTNKNNVATTCTQTIVEIVQSFLQRFLSKTPK